MVVGLADLPLIMDTLPELPNTSVMTYVGGEGANPYDQRFIGVLLDCIDEWVENSIVFTREKKGAAGAKKKKKIV